MAFIAPWFLALLPLAAAPVVFHLFFKVRKKPLPFSSLMFFLRIEPNLQAKRKLREILLLALRVLVIACVILALARPLLPALGGGGQCSLVVVLDNSGSMAGAAADGRPRLRIAAECAGALVGALGSGDLAAIVPAVDDPALNAGAGLSADKAGLRAALEQCTASEASADPAAALRRALAILANAGTPAREVHVFSDLQEGEWGRPAADALVASPGVSVVVHRIAAAAAPVVDVGIKQVRPPPSRIIAGRPARSELVLVNNSAAAASVQLRISDDRGDDTLRPVTVPAGGEVNVPVVLTPGDPGFHWAMARLEGDGFAADDRAGLGLWCGSRGQVAMVGRLEDYGLLPIALAPDGSGAISGLVPVATAADQLEGLLRQRKPLLVVISWSQLSALPLAPLAALKAYAAGGGALLVLPDLDGLRGVGQLPDWTGASPGREEHFAKPVPMIVLDASAPCWSEIRDPAGAVSIQGTQVSRCAVLTVDKGAQGLLGLADGRALLADAALGAGHVYTSAIAFHPAWSTLPLKGWSLALIQGLALPPQAEASRVLRLTAGQGLPPAPGDATRVRIRSLSGGPLDWQGRRELAPAFARAGVYEVDRADADQQSYVCVTSSAAEGVPRYLPTARVPVLGGLAHRVRDCGDLQAVVADFRAARHGADLFPWLVVLAALTWIGEGLVASAPAPGGGPGPRPARPGPVGAGDLAPAAAAPAAGLAGPPAAPAQPPAAPAQPPALAFAMLWTPHLPPLLLAALAIAMVVALVAFHRRLLTRMSADQAVRVWWPRAALAALLLLALLDPATRSERRDSAHGTLAVLVDTSSSMDVVDDGKRSRLERARALVETIRRRVPGGVQVQAMGFDTRLHDTLPAELPAGVRPGDPGVVLQSVAGDPRLSGTLGVVALTDGGDESFTLPTAPGVPLAIIGMGSLGEEQAKRWNNIAVAEVRSPASAEVHLDFAIEADLLAQAADPAFAARLGQVPVLLESASDAAGRPGWQEVARTSVDLGHGRAQVSFTQNADLPGLRRYRVSLPELSGEVSALDNSQQIAVEVREQSLHVLYFTRELGVEFKALRQELARDPGVTFTALFRTLTSPAGDRYTLQGDRLEGDGGLEKGFPTSAQGLTRYGCLVLGSFPASSWKAEELAALVDYIGQGGALVVLGGEQSFAGGGYAGSPLAAVLPWTLSAAAGEGAAFRRGAFAVTVPVAALAHPAMSGIQPLLSAGPASAAAAVDSVNLVGALKPGATALLETVIDGRPQPLVAIQAFGKGKVAAIATNTLWRLARSGAEGNSAYGRLWRQLVRHAADVGDQSHLVRVQWDKEHYRPGDEAVATITVLTSGASQARLAATLAGAGGEAQAAALESLPGQAGAVRTRLRFPERGDYRFRLVVYQDERVADTYDKLLVVAPRLGEGNRLRVDDAMLRAATTAIGAAYAPEFQAEQVLARLQGTLTGRPTVSEASLVNGNPWYLAAVLALLVGEWVLRRRRHLL
jgi:uncharacterized membrane protein